IFFKLHKIATFAIEPLLFSVYDIPVFGKVFSEMHPLILSFILLLYLYVVSCIAIYLLNLIFKKRKFRFLKIINYFLIIILIIASLASHLIWYVRNGGFLPDCDGIEDVREKNVCIMRTALHDGNPSLCESLVIESKEDDTKRRCYASAFGFKFFSSSKLGTCDEYDLPYSDDCYRRLAPFKNDVSICGNISDLEVKDACYDYMAKYHKE
ncbi:hypothetical protein ACFLY5_01290, partial [Patescibacteria group bacterium]